MNIFKRIWAWLIGTKKQDKEACVRNFEKEYEEFKQKQDNTVTDLNKYAKDFNRDSIVISVPRSPCGDYRRNSDANFMLGAVGGYIIADGLNNNSHRNVEETKSSNYESSYTPSSSSIYDSGSYSSSFDSGSSSSSCDSGC